jgi:hypothetical protein
MDYHHKAGRNVASLQSCVPRRFAFEALLEKIL